MSRMNEFRHPGIKGLNLDVDPNGDHGLIAENVDLHLSAAVCKRPGMRRLNHHHYNGAIVCIPDLQRICDYNKMLVLSGSGEVYEHNEPPGTDEIFDQGWDPVAVCAADVTTGLIPLTVNFSSGGSFDPDGGPLTYDWNFGDGAGSNQENPQHEYTTGGTKTVTLTVTDIEGKTATATMTVDPVSPTLVVAGATKLRYSEDLGSTWQDCAGGVPAGGGFGSHLLTLANGHVLFFAPTGPVWRSTDNGKTFALRGTLAPGRFELTICDPIELPSGRIVIALRVMDGASTGRWMAWSQDEGATWNKVKICDDALLSLSQTFIAPALFAASDRLLAVVYRQGGGAPGATVNQWFESLDFGATWAYKRDCTADETADISSLGSPWPESFGGDIIAFKGSAAGYNQMRSANAGLTTAIVAAALGNNILPIRHRNAEALSVRGNNPGAGQYSIYRSANSGATWALVQILATYTRRPLGSGIGWFIPLGNGTVWFSSDIAGPFASLGDAGAGTPDSMAMSPRV